MALLIKGVFVALIIIGAGWWALVNPRRVEGSIVRPIVAGAVSVAVLAAVALGYDAWYQHITGEEYWRPYWDVQLGQVSVSTPVDGGSTLLQHIGFYLVRLAWHPAPWSLALIAAAWRYRTSLAVTWRAIPAPARGGLVFALGYAALLILTLSPSSRVAERYIFSATYAIATAGIVVACRSFNGLSQTLAKFDRRVPALPALLWFALIIIRLGIGPWMTRI
jgi:hypothetical protein